MGPRKLKAQLGELDTNCNSSSFLKGIIKMEDVNVDPVSNHDKTDTQAYKTGETVPLTPGGVGGAATWEPERETPFVGMSIREKVLREHIEGLYRKLSEIARQTPEAFHFDNLKLEMGNCATKASACL